VIGILTGFAVIALAVFVGWLAARTGALPPEARPVLARLNFNVLAPFLLFSVLATADVGALFSALLPVSAVTAIAMMAVFALVALLVWRRTLAHTVVGSLASGYVNGNNFGIPIAVYMLGDAAWSAPVVLLQLLLFAPVALAVLGAKVEGRTSAWVIIRSTLTNRIIVGSLLGVLVAVSGIELPPIVLDPIELIGHAAVPLMLIAELAQDDPLRETAATASYLRTSLFTSIVAFGVALLAAGTGVIAILYGWSLLALGRRRV